MVSGSGFGKIILFGEHLVVHGSSAIAVGLSNKLTVEIEKSNQNDIITDYEVMYDLNIKTIQKIEDVMKIKDKFKIHLSGDLPIVGGLGSSAAYCVAIARAFSTYYKRNLSNEEINKIAYEGEKVFHGTPSGIDNLLATYGGAIEYSKSGGFKQIPIGKSFYLVVGITGKSSLTKRMVENVSLFKSNNPEEYEKIQNLYSNIKSKAKESLKLGDLETLGALMNENQEILRKLGISYQINEELISRFEKAKPLGSKVTGGGGGGCCIALANSSEHAKLLLNSLKSFNGFITKIEKS